MITGSISILSDGTANGTRIYCGDGTDTYPHPVAFESLKLSLTTQGVIEATLTPLVTDLTAVVGEPRYDMVVNGKLKIIKRVVFEDGSDWTPETGRESPSVVAAKLLAIVQIADRWKDDQGYGAAFTDILRIAKGE